MQIPEDTNIKTNLKTCLVLRSIGVGKWKKTNKQEHKKKPDEQEHKHEKKNPQEYHGTQIAGTLKALETTKMWEETGENGVGMIFCRVCGGGVGGRGGK